MASKKRKAAQEEEEVQSGTDDEIEETQGSPKRKLSSKNYVEDEEDDDDDSNDEMDLDEVTMTHGRTEAEVGVIEEITLINFMCHKHLNLKLGPNINFIVGQNGSGKSAVLVAISVGLGAKAGFTARGSKLSDLIRGNSQKATIIIRLRNRGSESYKHDVFGESIIIERSISRESGTGYKIKTHKGSVVKGGASEVQMILEHFNIQVNNPIAVLMQETTKAFLTTAKAKDKYKFFLKATQLDQMEEDFRMINGQKEQLKSMIETKKKLLPEMEKQLKEYHREYQDVQEIKNLEIRKEELKQQMTWALVKEAEDKLSEVDLVMSKHKAELDRYYKIENDLISTKTKQEEEAKNSQVLLTNVLDKIDKQRALQEEIKVKQKDLNSEYTKRKGIEKNLSTTRVNLTGRKERLVQKIKEVKAKAAAYSENEAKQRMLQISNKRREIDEIQLQMNSETKTKNELEKSSSEFSSQMERMRFDIELKQKKKTDLVTLISRLETQKKDKVKMFGENVPQLLDLLKKNEGKFKQMPLGPVGLSLRVKNDKWATAVETCVQARNLKAFLISEEDEKLFQALMKQANCQMPFNFQKEDKYEIPAHLQPDPKWTSILNMIETDHWLIRNFLVDSCKIEEKILIETTDEARSVMFEHRPPQNVREVFTLDGSRFFVANGAQNVVGGDNKRKFISVNIDEEIKRSKQQIPAIDQEIKSMNDERIQIEKQRNKAKDEADKIRHGIHKMQAKCNGLEREIKELESVREEAPEDTSELEENLKNLEKNLEDNSKDIEEAQKAVNEIMDQLQPYQDSLKERSKALDSLLAEMNPISENAKNVAARLQETETRIATCSGHIDKIKKDVVKTEQLLKERKEAVNTVTEKAIQVYPERVDVDKSPSLLDKEISQLDKRIAKEKEGKRDVDKIERQYLDAKKKWNEINKKVKAMQTRITTLETNLNERVRRWNSFRTSIAKRTKLIFGANLSQKGYSGTIHFEHKKGELEIEVELDKMRPEKQQQKVRDTKSLSGGERSYSTVCLLLALWEAMECPFRAMDEFDVFMDAVNRQISIELLIEAAREHKHRQFIFITPHDYSGISGGPDVRIHRMHPPERGQSQLNFGTQASQE